MNGPKFRLVSDGKHTYFELCGKSIGKGISSVSYVHEAGRNPEITISFSDILSPSLCTRRSNACT